MPALFPAGSANICPYALSVMDSETLIAVITHEMVHALGEAGP